jgi:hypothetical protein
MITHHWSVLRNHSKCCRETVFYKLLSSQPALLSMLSFCWPPLALTPSGTPPSLAPTLSQDALQDRWRCPPPAIHLHSSPSWPSPTTILRARPICTGAAASKPQGEVTRAHQRYVFWRTRVSVQPCSSCEAQHLICPGCDEPLPDRGSPAPIMPTQGQHPGC